MKLLLWGHFLNDPVSKTLNALISVASVTWKLSLEAIPTDKKPVLKVVRAKTATGVQLNFAFIGCYPSKALVTDKGNLNGWKLK